MNSTPTLGIDFGTTKTLVSYIHPETERPEPIHLGRGTHYLPTSIFVEEDGSFLFGDDADDEMTRNTARYSRGFKMKLGSSMPVIGFYDGTRFSKYTAKELTVAFLKHIKKECEEHAFMGKTVRKAVITCPVSFSPAQCAELEEAADLAGFTEVQLVTEPEAAGLAFCRLCPESSFKGNALIIDWGGGTLDMALVGRKGNQVSIYPEYTAGDMNMGGEVFDMRLWQHVTHLLKSAHNKDLSKESTEIQGSLLRRIRQEKEMLSKQTLRKVRLSTVHGALPPVEITRNDFEQLITVDVERASGLAKQLCNSITQTTLKPEILLLVGGTSLVPCITSTLEKCTGLPCRQWQFSREAVSLGAALMSTYDSTSKDDSTSMYKTGIEYFYGFNGKKRNLTKAYEAFTQAANQHVKNDLVRKASIDQAATRYAKNMKAIYSKLFRHSYDFRYKIGIEYLYFYNPTKAIEIFAEETAKCVYNNLNRGVIIGQNIGEMSTYHSISKDTNFSMYETAIGYLHGLNGKTKNLKKAANALAQATKNNLKRDKTLKQVVEGISTEYFTSEKNYYSMYVTGINYLHGVNGKTKNLDKAIEIFTQATSQCVKYNLDRGGTVTKTIEWLFDNLQGISVMMYYCGEYHSCPKHFF